MATLTITNVPASLMITLNARASLSKRTVEEVVLQLLQQHQHLLERAGETEPGSLDFSRPVGSVGSVVVPQASEERLPKPLQVEESLPE